MLDFSQHRAASIADFDRRRDKGSTCPIRHSKRVNMRFAASNSIVRFCRAR